MLWCVSRDQCFRKRRCEAFVYDFLSGRCNLLCPGDEKLDVCV